MQHGSAGCSSFVRWVIEERDWSVIVRPPGSTADFRPGKNRRFVIDQPRTYLVRPATGSFSKIISCPEALPADHGLEVSAEDLCQDPEFILCTDIDDRLWVSATREGGKS